ncbi:MAG TPA: cupin domain-containing protein [Opitutales bacterium]|jgi:mannose-6-phosphate isomerase-like protein (cupin superfamily)|nr:cupin domain-containing protein [Opitutales bacterium]
MKSMILSSLLALLAGAIYAQNSAPAPAPAPDATVGADGKMLSHVYNWDKMIVTPRPNGVRRDVFDAPTATLTKLHCHISTLNPGERSGAPSLHVQEEVIIVKEGTVEATYDGKSVTSGPGSVIYFAAGATTALHNPGTTPATYIVLNYFPPGAPQPAAATAPAPATTKP